MRTLAISALLLTATVAVPLQARGRNESYISYDDGGTVVRQGDQSDRETEARLNLPVFPGDEVITNRRGRAEVRLADGNVLAIDRASSILFRSILDSYDTESNDTVAELRYGKVAVLRSGDASESFRLDTPSASYFAGSEAVFSVDSDSRGKDRLQVFSGRIEVRSPSRTWRVRGGESAEVDDKGLYHLARDGQSAADDFERWFLERSERFGNSSSRYLDRSIAYSDEDLSRHGNWTFITGFGWGWRPFVGVSWRPYYHGQWTYGPAGSLTWVSYEPWGWVPYHYGRWSFDPQYGWFWLPGSAYSPAWVYWMYSPGYIGWAPAGWYDCYRPYYDWAYRPYARAGIDFGFGFYGRVRVRELDLRPWTFVNANTIISGRVDRAAIATDIVRGRLTRGPSDLAAISGSPARFGRDDRRDPAGAVNELYRRGLTGATGQVMPPTDMTPFFRRDADLPGSIRDRIVRTRPVDGLSGSGTAGVGSIAPIGTGSVAPIGPGSLSPIGRGSVAPIGVGGSESAGGGLHRGDGTGRDNGGSAGWSNGRDSGGRINRGGGNDSSLPRSDGSRQVEPAVPAPSWRGRVVRPTPGESSPAGSRSDTPTPPAGDRWRDRSPRDSGEGSLAGRRPAEPAPPPPVERWRDRSPRDSSEGSAAAERPAADAAGRSRSVRRESGENDVPRRVIDGIGQTRIYRGEPSPPPRAPEARPPARESSPPPPPRQEAPPARNEGGHSSDGGRIHRDQN